MAYSPISPWLDALLQLDYRMHACDTVPSGIIPCVLQELLIRREREFREFEIFTMDNVFPEDTGLPMIIYTSMKVGMPVLHMANSPNLSSHCQGHLHLCCRCTVVPLGFRFIDRFCLGTKPCTSVTDHDPPSRSSHPPHKECQP